MSSFSEKMKKFQTLLTVGVILGSLGVILAILAVPVFCGGCQNDNAKTWYPTPYLTYLLKGAKHQGEVYDYQQHYLAIFFLHVFSISFSVVAVVMAAVAICAKFGNSSGYMIAVVTVATLAVLLLVIATILNGVTRKHNRDLYSGINTPTIELEGGETKDNNAKGSGSDDEGFINRKRPKQYRRSNEQSGDAKESKKAKQWRRSNEQSGDAKESKKAKQAFDVRLALLAMAACLLSGAVVCFIMALCDTC